MLPCPVCARPVLAQATRCPSCGADLLDPDVRALAGTPQPPAAIAAVPEGSLSVGRFLGVTLDGLQSGRAVRRVAAVMGALLVIAFFVPTAQIPHWELVYDRTAMEYVNKVRWEYKMAWELFADGPGLALLLPLFAGVLGIGVAVVPRLSPVVRGGALTVLGLAGWTLGLGQLGAYGKAPSSVINLIHLGVAVTGTALFLRLLEPGWRPARIAVAVGAGITALGYLIPIVELARVFPEEFTLYSSMLKIDLTTSPPLFAILSAMSPRAAPILFLAGFAILPFLIAPLCAWLAWSPPKGAWDKMGIALRPLGWIIVLFVPLWYGMMAFNLLGWGSVSADEAMLPRARLAVIGAGYFLWIQLGAATVGTWVRQRELGRSVTGRLSGSSR